MLRDRAAMCAILATQLDGTVATLHGLTAREVSLIGWLVGPYAVMDGDDWLARFAATKTA